MPFYHKAAIIRSKYMISKKKRLIPVLLSAVMVGSCFASCTSLVSTNSEKDMAQVVATVDITKSDDFASDGQYARYADAISSENVTKRDLVAYFINQGYTLVQNGSTYSDAFDKMLDSLIGRKIVSQYAKVYFFENYSSEYTIEGYKAAVASSDRATIEGLKYFLSDEEYELAVYNLKCIINNTLDSSEKEYIHEKDEVSYTESVRTLPTGVDTQTEDYYDPDYEIYTGKNAPSACGSYEAVEGSTATTRKKAYNSFLSSLKNNYLLSSSEAGLDDIEQFEYWYSELEGQLESALINKLGDVIEEEAEASLTKEFVENRYAEIFASQKKIYDTSADSFESDLDSLSDSSFVTYAPVSGYGFVYNILIPFSTTQSAQYEKIKNKNLSEEETYLQRAALLSEITATDQRGSWMTGETDYSFSASENGISVYGDSDTIFFENNLVKNDKYESLEKYYGRYAYNGKIEVSDESDEHGYTLTPNKLSIDGFIGEMEDYFAFAGLTAKGEKNTNYMTSVLDNNGKVDYSAFLYYTGKVDVGTFSAGEAFVKDTKAYTAMSVVNELMFAYNTDTAGLNSYLGYAVSAYDTQFVKEFEYAAKAAVAGGVGTYTVAPSDYGWHIMYCTYTFGEGEVSAFDWKDIEREGSFSYNFYESLKTSTSGNKKQVFQTQTVNTYKTSACVETYKERYADYAALDNES